jgi:hypothetical protein
MHEFFEGWLSTRDLLLGQTIRLASAQGLTNVTLSQACVTFHDFHRLGASLRPSLGPSLEATGPFCKGLASKVARTPRSTRTANREKRGVGHVCEEGRTVRSQPQTEDCSQRKLFDRHRHAFLQLRFTCSRARELAPRESSGGHEHHHLSPEHSAPLVPSH